MSELAPRIENTNGWHLFGFEFSQFHSEISLGVQVKEATTVSKQEALIGVKSLVDKFKQYLDNGHAQELNEAQTRNEFIEPLFSYLGWDMRNINLSDEVVTEYAVSNGRVDLAFRVGGSTKFLLEAKAIKVNLDDWEWAKQAINYSWNRAVNWAVLTDFQGLKVFNAEIPPTNLANNLFFELNWDEFVSRFDELWVLSRSSSEEDRLEKVSKAWKKSEKRTNVTFQLFDNLTTWRDNLTFELEPVTSLSQADKDEAIQKLLDRLIFIRAAEDRKIIEQVLRILARDGKEESLWRNLVRLFQKLDKSFNSKLFAKHPLEELPFSSATLRRIITELYDSPDGYTYDFSAISGDLLGSIYERYLTFTQLADSERTEKSKRKLRGIFYTPEPVVDYLLSNTIDELLKSGRAPSSIKILDPACGSGSFLINAFDRIVRARSVSHDSNLLDFLDTATQNIYGIDIDEQATEIAKLNILLRCLKSDAQLPDLSGNIVSANTLLSPSMFATMGGLGDTAIEDTPFSLNQSFPDVAKAGGFDLIVGNPPYVFARDKSFSKPMKAYLTETYKVAQYQINTYALFIERAFELLRDGGYLAFIVPNTWLTIQTHKALRMLLANNTSSLKIVNVFDKVFPDAAVDVSLVVCQKGSGDLLEILELVNGEFKLKCHADKGLIESGIPISITALSNPISIPMLEKIDAKSSPLESCAEVFSGFMAYEVGKGKPKQTTEMMESRVYHHRSQPGKSGRRYLEGRDVKRYLVSWGGAWIEYGENLAAMRDPEIFNGPRLLVRQIPSKPPYCIEATFTDDDFVHDRNSNVVRNLKSITSYALLAVLNSKVLSFWFVHYFDKLQRKTFPQFKTNELAVFPVPISNKGLFDFLEVAGLELVTLNKKLSELEPGFNTYEVLLKRIQDLEAQIEKNLCDHYGFSENELDYLNAF